MVYKRDAPEAQRRRSPAPTTTGRCEMTAAQTIAALRDLARRSTTSRPRSSSTRSCTSSTRSAAGSRPTRPGSAARAATTMAELGGEPQATVIGLDDATAGGRTPPSPTRCSATASTSTTRTPTRSRTSRPWSRPAALAAGEAARRVGQRACSRRSSPATRSSAGSAWPRPGSSTPAASTRRRSAASSAPPRPSARLARLRRRDDDRARSGSPARWRPACSPTSTTGRRRSRSTRPGRRTARTSPRGSPTHGADGPQSRARGQVRRLPRLPRRRATARSTSTAQLADLGERWETPADRVQAVPGLPLHARLARRDRRRAATAGSDAGRDRRTSSSPSPQAGVSLVLEPAEREDRAALGVRGRSSRLQYSAASMLVRGHVAVVGLHRRGDRRPGASSAVARKVRYETPEYPTYPQAFPGGVRDHADATGETLEARLRRTRRAARRTRCRADEVRAKFRDNAGLALDGRAGARSKTAILALEQQSDLSAALAPLTLRGGRRV